MAPLTWREVSAPNFSGVTESQRLAGTLINSGFESAMSALDGLGKSQNEAASAEYMRRISQFGGDPAALDAALSNGSLTQGLNGTVSADAIKFADSHRSSLLNDARTGVQTEGDRLINQNRSLTNDQLQWSQGNTRSYEAARPAAVDLVNQIKSYAQQGTPEGRAKADELTRGGSQIFAAAGWSPDDIVGLVNGNLSTNDAGVSTNTNLRNQGDAVLAHDQDTAANELAADVMKWAGNDVIAAERSLRDNPTIDPTVASKAIARLGSDDFKTLQGPDTNVASYQLRQAVEARQNGTSPGAGSLLNLIDSTEGGGRYDTLYGHSQGPGGKFEGVDVTKMTLNDLNQFDGDYGSWVKDQAGRVATPVGRFQIVGDTRRQVAKEMGLPGDTVFTPQVQDAMFLHLVDKRIAGPRSMDAKITGLRQEWEGFKNVPDATLAQAITAYQGGDTSALLGITGQGQGQNQAQGQSARPFSTSGDLFKSALDAHGALTNEQNDALFKGTTEIASQAAAVMDAMTVDGLTGDAQLASSLLDQGLSNESQLDSVARVRAALGPDMDLKDPELLENINTIKDKYDMSFGQAASVIANSLHQEPWILQWIQGKTNVDFGSKMDALVGRIYNKDGKTKGEKFRPALNLLETFRSKQNAASKLSEGQAQVAAAQQRYVNLLERSKTNSTPTLERELQRAQLEYQALLGTFGDTVTSINKDPRIGFNAEQ